MRRTTAPLLFSWALGFLVPAHAQDIDHGRFYAGVSVGRSSIDGRAEASANTPSLGLPTSISINGLPFDDDDTAWSAFVGYSATRYLGVEAGFWDHGSFDTTLVGPQSASLSIKEWYFGATFRYPVLPRLAITGSAGISRAQFEVDGALRAIVIGPPTIPTLPGFPILPIPPPFTPGTIVDIPLREPDDETGAHWQFGLAWQVTDRVELDLNYGTRALKVHDVELLGLAVRWMF